MDIFSNIGVGELLFIFIIILLVMGPHRLPEISKMLGQTLRKLQETYQEFIATFEEELRTVEETSREVREEAQLLKEAVDLSVPSLKTSAETTTAKPTPELIDALPTHNFGPRERANEDGPADD